MCVQVAAGLDDFKNEKWKLEVNDDRCYKLLTCHVIYN